MRLVFMGSPDFAIPSMQALIERYQVVGVISQPDRPAGRGRQTAAPPVKQLALDHGLAIEQPTTLRSDQALQMLNSWSPDVIVVAAFGQILPPSVLDLPMHGCLNVHASLLPRWRGAAPVQATIAHGDELTGVTIMQMDPGLDTGPILRQRSTPIGPDETGGELTARLAQLGADLLVETLAALFAGDLEATPQADEGATHAPMLKKSDGVLDFDQPAAVLARIVRAYQPWPGTHFFWQGNRLAVLAAHAAREAVLDTDPGHGTELNGLPAVATSDGWLVLDRVQPAGRQPVPGDAFLRGARGFVGAKMAPGPA
jgi:methionyl-tRNA formyltransferase